ncbi:amino acid ABC transporter ATP-binding protein [Ligilactobacillus ruminis]|uniref:Polar amino acid ABC transporter ATP-binding protein n=3 Tax=Ligilactobacillus ruminis TaxID=1623 RepID=G2SPW1_LIGR2|nr:amino acid ABC transporter ATP-binding protein [Ligilactobacillus ruminis]AEN78563.1 polar amino acid ABC transporter ATP-binding protein [Ligilactobacillus ruminis ATCC 27782]KLA47215.1 polar amino acid ABC transporter ATP-binding protein [Ligilactobacillus ruminis]KRM83567.1 polar amino acid ABC transporter ATP-binding protein [Ligilactobacillus ruminis DSM 20403 = NBRC 102161]MDD6171240.1 amino acid ABC transporter ATP-binding protein [Ligilactobacillus ruminis]SFG26610.1 polar amino aci
MLELKNIKKSFSGRKILDGISLKVTDGEIMCIVGQSGGGKTTLLRCISGLERIDEGEMMLDGKKFDPMSSKEALIGVVFQEYNLFPHLSVLENVTLAPKIALKKDPQAVEKEARQLLKKLALEGKENLYPYQLSGGQKQRVSIARALAMHPKILCYDEPTSALDPGLRDKVRDIILSLKKESMTQIIVTHDLKFAREIADDVLKVRPVS